MHTSTLIETLRSLRTNKEIFFDYIDQSESTFNLLELEIQAFVPEENRFDRLREEAGQLFQEYPDTRSRPDLFGLLIGVKDIFHVDGFPTRAGSTLPTEMLTGQQAHVVTRMRQAGALILGKTVTTEFAYFAPGPTRNPHNPRHTPGGSSSGSAAAVAAGLVPFATGTQTIGSISRPASYCGVIGYKPSYGRISAKGVIPLAPSVDHIGFFTGDMAGAGLMADILVEGWNPDLAQARQPVFGIPAGPYLDYASTEMLDHFYRTCDQLASAGYTVKVVQMMPDFEQIKNRHNTIVAAEAFAVHKHWFEQYAERYHPKSVELILRGKGIPESELEEALAGREKLRNQFSRSMEENEIDLWLSPGAPGAAPEGLESTGDPVMNLPWTHCGLPTICLPSGRNDEHLPLGLQVAGPWHQDETLIDWTTKLELTLRGDSDD